MKNKNKKITPEFVLQRINEARVKEELAIPIYSSHIKQTLFWSGLPKDKQEKIISGLKILEGDSMRHSKMLQKIASNYSKNNK